jgi:hypothetical protein
MVSVLYDSLDNASQRIRKEACGFPPGHFQVVCRQEAKGLQIPCTFDRKR